LHLLLAKILLGIIIISTVLTFVPLRVSATATIIIAASNSSSQWKSQAVAICDGIADQSELNKYLLAGNTVILAPGKFECNDRITPQTGSRLTGQGNTSVIELSNTAMSASDVSNVELDNFKVIGTSLPSGAVVISSSNPTSNNFILHDILVSTTGGDDFVLYVSSGGTISNTALVRCDASNPDGFGFLINGEGTNPLVQDTTFYQCSVENAGVASSRTNNFVTGFDFAEYAGMTVNRLQAIKCTVNGAWESDFHFEQAPPKYQCVIMGCTANNAGRKADGALYGAGYLVDGNSDTLLFDNNGGSNYISDIRAWNGSAFINTTPVTDEKYPPWSNKTTIGVLLGNCKGMIVTYGVYKDLYLYSIDNNPINQEIELNDYYMANDGNTYIIYGTKIVAQFNDYAIIRLVKTPPITITTPTTMPTTTTTTTIVNITTKTMDQTTPATATTTLPMSTTPPNVGPESKQVILLPILLGIGLPIFLLLFLFSFGWFDLKVINRDGTLNLALIIFLVSLLITTIIMAIVAKKF